MEKASIRFEGVIGEIEKNVPLPQSWNVRASGLPETLRALEAGDSFHFNGPKTSPHVLAWRLGIKITLRKDGDGFRVWRVPSPCNDIASNSKGPARKGMRIIRNERVVFAVKIKKGCCFAIAFSTDVTDEQALAMARDARSGEWQKMDISSLRFL